MAVMMATVFIVVLMRFESEIGFRDNAATYIHMNLDILLKLENAIPCSNMICESYAIHRTHYSLVAVVYGVPLATNNLSENLSILIEIANVL